MTTTDPPATPPVEIWPGRPAPLGAHWDGQGTNFAVFSEQAESIDLCLFDLDGEAAGTETCIPIEEVDSHTWHVYLPGVGPGTHYGYRVTGPWNPDGGQWFNHNKLLLDPYAKAIEGEVAWDEACFAYVRGDEDTMNETDSAPFVPRSVIATPWFDWSTDRPPDTPMERSVIYELHVKGFTQLHPAVPEHLRGTYAGLAHPAVIEYLTDLGVTAVELQPVHHFIHDSHLVEQGLRNYWGYNSIGFFAPHAGYSSATRAEDAAGEFKSMVRDFHQAGLEVILDVVFNHTAEGNHLGPVLSFKGLDNHAYYRLMDDEPKYYRDFTGTGNSLNMRHPSSLQLVMDSLRYWVTEMHVDGFRFDLAAALARELYDVDRLSAFFDLIQQDPIISRVKLIAEPWDVGEGGYQVGNFPPLWSEWNGKYRDTIRDLWRGEGGVLGDVATRMAGSSDLYSWERGSPTASINFVTAHDGFTLRDLVSYNEKHNEANGEDNNDGESHNRSWNCGTEGPTDDPDILRLRGQQLRNLLATLLMSQGVPMLLAGDELGRTQQGNNNTYCQDNELNWIDWTLLDEDADGGGPDAGSGKGLWEATKQLIALRAEHPALRRRRWLTGHEDGEAAVRWLHPDGHDMADGDWDGSSEMAMLLDGTVIPERGPRGEVIRDDRILLLIDAGSEPTDWSLPPTPGSWVEQFSSALGSQLNDDGTYRTPGRSVVVFVEAAD